MYHHEMTGESLHVIHAYTYADAAARAAASGFLSTDVGKVAFQSDDMTFFILSGYSPVVWVQLAVGGTTGVTGSFEAINQATGKTSVLTVVNGIITTMS